MTIDYLEQLPLWGMPVLLIPVIFVLRPIRGEVFLFRDHLHHIAPKLLILAGGLREGRLPAWTSLLFGGAPFLAEPGTGVFYPPSWLALVMYLPTAATVFVLVHLPLAAAGCLLFAHLLGASRTASALAATAYVGSGYLLSMHGGGFYFASAAWLPATIGVCLRLGQGWSPLRFVSPSARLPGLSFGPLPLAV